MEQLEFSYTHNRDINLYNHFGKLALSTKHIYAHTHITKDHCILLLCIYTKVIYDYINQNTCKRTFIATLLM